MTARQMTFVMAGMCALAFLAYLAAWPEAPILDGDSPQYLDVARDLADGRLDTVHLRTPGYPLLLALTGSIGEPTRALFHVSLLLHMASMCLLAWATHRIGVGGMWIGGLCLLLLLPPYAEPAAYVMTENFAQAALVLGFVPLLLWEQRRATGWALAAGVAFSWCALIRPVYQGLTPAIAAVVLVWPFIAGWPRAVRSAGLRAAGVLVLTWMALLGGYAAHNYVSFGWFGVAPSTGMHLTTKTAGFLERLPDEYAVVREALIRHRDAELIKRGGTHTGTQAVWAARSELEAATGLSLPELSGYLVRMNVTLIRRAPMEYLEEVARSVAIYWFPAAGPLASMGSPALRWLWLALHVLLVLLFLVQLSAVVGTGALIVTTWRRDVFRPQLISIPSVGGQHVFAYAVAMTVVFYTLALSCLVDIGEPRQRRPTDVFIVFACVLGAWVWWRAARDWRVGARAVKGYRL